MMNKELLEVIYQGVLGILHLSLMWLNGLLNIVESNIARL